MHNLSIKFSTSLIVTWPAGTWEALCRQISLTPELILISYLYIAFISSYIKLIDTIFYFMTAIPYSMVPFDPSFVIFCFIAAIWSHIWSDIFFMKSNNKAYFFFIFFLACNFVPLLMNKLDFQKYIPHKKTIITHSLDFRLDSNLRQSHFWHQSFVIPEHNFIQNIINVLKLHHKTKQLQPRFFTNHSLRKLFVLY